MDGQSCVSFPTYETQTGDDPALVMCQSTAAWQSDTIVFPGVFKDVDYWISWCYPAQTVRWRYDTVTAGYEDTEYKSRTYGDYMPFAFPSGLSTAAWETWTYIDYTASTDTPPYDWSCASKPTGVDTRIDTGGSYTWGSTDYSSPDCSASTLKIVSAATTGYQQEGRAWWIKPHGSGLQDEGYYGAFIRIDEEGFAYRLNTENGTGDEPELGETVTGATSGATGILRWKNGTWGAGLYIEVEDVTNGGYSGGETLNFSGGGSASQTGYNSYDLGEQFFEVLSFYNAYVLKILGLRVYPSTSENKYLMSLHARDGTTAAWTDYPDTASELMDMDKWYYHAVQYDNSETGEFHLKWYIDGVEVVDEVVDAYGNGFDLGVLIGGILSNDGVDGAARGSHTVYMDRITHSDTSVPTSPAVTDCPPRGKVNADSTKSYLLESLVH